MTKYQKELRRKYTKIHQYTWSKEVEVVLKVDQQTFFVRAGGTRWWSEANWFRDQLAIALERMIEHERPAAKRNPPKRTRKRVSRRPRP